MDSSAPQRSGGQLSVVTVQGEVGQIKAVNTQTNEY